MGKKTNNQTSTTLGNEVVLIPVSEKGGMGIEQTKALMELMITTTSYDADGDEDNTTREVIRGRNENDGAACYDLREGEGKSAMMEGYVRSQRSHRGYDIRIDPRKIEAFENAARRMHFSTIDDCEPKLHLHNVIHNCVRHELPSANAELRIIHTARPRTKGKSAVAGRVTDIYRGSAGLPLAGTVFDPRRYRRIK